MGNETIAIDFVFPTGEMRAAYVDSAKKVKDLRQPFKLAADDLQKDIDEQFRKQGAGRSGKWASLRPITQEIRGQDGYNPTTPIMERTGALRSSFVRTGAKGHVRKITPKSMTVGSNLQVHYKGKTWTLGAIHEDGWSQITTRRQEAYFAYRWGIHLGSDTHLELEKRKIMFVSPAALKRMITRHHDYVLKVLGDSFKGLVSVHARI